jgi:hypothetical protein
MTILSCLLRILEEPIYVVALQWLTRARVIGQDKKRPGGPGRESSRESFHPRWRTKFMVTPAESSRREHHPVKPLRAVRDGV